MCHGARRNVYPAMTRPKTERPCSRTITRPPRNSPQNAAKLARAIRPVPGNNGRVYDAPTNVDAIDPTRQPRSWLHKAWPCPSYTNRGFEFSGLGERYQHIRSGPAIPLLKRARYDGRAAFARGGVYGVHPKRAIHHPHFTADGQLVERLDLGQNASSAVL